VDFGDTFEKELVLLNDYKF